ncbi:flagellar biosynthesis protein FlhF [Halothiobacillus sp. DCM-1]|uniref:flagellar biosynthesis protein FlhF n=1 Tax=Halothiobacillus sp. DCM-1 TaxID=3112558 RepID=UPI0032441260
MNIKRIIASDMREAMRQVRQLFGEEAAILSNRSCAEGVELVIAVDFDEQTVRQKAAQVPPVRVAGAAADTPDVSLRVPRWTPPPVAPVEPLPPVNPPPASSGDADVFAQALASFDTRADAPPRAQTAHARSTAGTKTSTDRSGYQRTEDSSAMAALSAEITELRSLFERQLSVMEWHRYSQAHPAEMETRDRLQALGFPVAIAKILAQQSSGQTPGIALAAALRQLGKKLKTPSTSVFRQGGIFALIGPAGVGKTTTLAKIAAQTVLERGRDAVALITTDRYRIGAQEQLRNYARILNIPLHVARDEAHLAQLLPAVSQKHLVLIDTAGMSARDLAMMNQLAELPAMDQRLRLFLVLSAQTQYNAMLDALSHFQRLPLAGMILTKLDETLLLGSALAVLAQSGLPLICTGVGQRVPEDLSYPTGDDLITQAVSLGRTAATAEVATDCAALFSA